MPKRRRRRGQGSVYFDHASKSWMARFPLGVRNGRRVGKKVRARSEQDANAKLEQLRRLYGAGGEPATGNFDDFLHGWLRDHGPSVRGSTLVSYTGHVDLHISPLLGGIPLASLRPADVRRLIDDRLRSGLSPSTVGRVITTLRIALGQALRDGTIASNPAAQVRLPRVDRQPVAALTEAQAERVTEAVRGSFLDALVVLMLGSGLRLGEAIGLDWGDVQDGFVLVRKSKTKARAVPISDDAAEALRRHKARAKRIGSQEPVFIAPRGTERMRPDTASHAFPRLLERGGLPRMRVHDLRHGAATLMVARGAHMRVVAEQLGHRNPDLTARVYAHIVPAQQVEAVRLLNRRKA